MFASIRSRLLLSYLILTGLILLVTFVSLWLFLSNTPLLDRLYAQRLETWAETIAERREAAVLPGARLAQQAERLDRLTQARLLIFDDGGALVVDSRQELAPALPAQEWEDFGDTKDESGRRWTYASRPLTDGGLLVLATPRPGLRLALLSDDVMRLLLRAGLAALAVSVLLAALLGGWLAGPLRRMVPAARGLASGAGPGSIPVEGPDEARALARALNDMAAQVQSSQQVQRDFVANISHELKTPLTSIQGFAQALLDDTADDTASRRRAAQVILDEAERMRRLVDDLLSLARIDAGQVVYELQLLDLVPVLRAVVDRMSMMAEEKGVRLEAQLRPLPPLMGDGDWLAQVFTNLMDNALRHTPPNGWVGVSTEVETGHIVVKVEDSGPGIPESERERIFERFYQADKSRRGGDRRGSGLGLAISRQIVQAHGGTLQAASRQQAGACFVARLPIYRGDDSTISHQRRR